MKLLSSGLLLAGTAMFSGCILIESAQEMGRQSARVFKLRETDYRDTSEEVSTEWDFVGDEARAIRGVEKDPDPWFKKYFMSEQARSIERNLGID